MSRDVDVEALARAIYEREMSVEEFDAEVQRALADEEDMQQLVELIQWFRRRYPTAKERLAYARRQYIASQRPRRLVRRHGT